MDSTSAQREAIQSLLDSAYQGRVSDVKLSLEQAQKALGMAREMKDMALVGKSLNHISLFYMIVGENQLSMDASQESISCFTELNDEMGIADARFNIGSVLYKSDNYHSGLINLIDALAIYRKHNAHGKESRVYKTVGTIYEFFGDAKKALAAYQRAVGAARLAGDVNMESNAYNPLSGIYLDQGNIPKALELIENSIEMKNRTGDIRGLAFALYGRGKIFTQTRQYEEAELDFNEAGRIHTEMGEKLGLAMNFYKTGILYIAMGKPEKALAVLLEGRAFCEKHNISQFKYKIDFQLHKVYRQTGETDLSLYHLEEYLAVKDAVINIETLRIIETYELISGQQLSENKELLQAKQLVEKQNEKLVKANAELDQFVYRASHDLRAPISSIMGLANIGMNAENLEDAKHYFGMIHKRVQAQDYFIRQIVENARNARLAPEPEEVNIRSLIQDVIDSLFFVEGVEKVKIMIAVDEAMTVFADVSRLRSVINNLVSNAIQYRDEGKTEPFVHISCAYHDGAWMLTVKDNGQGIVPDRQDKVFNMFYRANQKSVGSGLGLFIVKESVEKLGGDISFESEQAVGSTFRARFPVS